MTGVMDYTLDTSPETIFATNASIITSPEATDGPYYVWGELVRKDVKEASFCSGVDMYLEVQWTDISTCTPVPNIMVDTWNRNATGTYNGFESG